MTPDQKEAWISQFKPITPKYKPTVLDMYRAIKNTNNNQKLQVKCHRFRDNHIIEIATKKGYEVERTTIAYKVNNGKVRVG